MTNKPATQTKARISYDKESTNERFYMEDGQADGMQTFILDGGIKFVAEWDASYEVEQNNNQAEPNRLSNIKVFDDISYSEFKSVSGGREVSVPEVLIDAADQNFIKAEIARLMNDWFAKEELQRLEDMETKIVGYDLFFEVKCPDLELKVFTDVRVMADSILYCGECPRLALILNALDNEGFADEDSIKKQLLEATKGDKSEDYEDIEIWNYEKTMSYSLDRIVPLKEVAVSVKYDGEMCAKTVLLPLCKEENYFGRYFN